MLFDFAGLPSDFDLQSMSADRQASDLKRHVRFPGSDTPFPQDGPGCIQDDANATVRRFPRQRNRADDQRLLFGRVVRTIQVHEHLLSRNQRPGHTSKKHKTDPS